MADLLVRLYDLPQATTSPAARLVRRAFAAEKHLVLSWIAQHFSRAWADECETAFARLPISCFLAVDNEQLLGFACYDATARAFFGPFGVMAEARGRGLGRALLHATLHDMRANGYAYGIVGAAADPAFYRNEVGAIEIPDSDPGFYRGLLRS